MDANKRQMERENKMIELQNTIEEGLKEVDEDISGDSLQFDRIFDVFDNLLKVYNTCDDYTDDWFWKSLIKTIISKLNGCQKYSRLESSAGWFAYIFGPNKADQTVPGVRLLLNEVNDILVQNVIEENDNDRPEVIGACFALALFVRMYTDEQVKELFTIEIAEDKTLFSALGRVMMHPNKFHVQARIFASHALLRSLECFRYHDELKKLSCCCPDCIALNSISSSFYFPNALRRHLEGYKRTFEHISGSEKCQEFQAIVLVRLVFAKLTKMGINFQSVLEFIPNISQVNHLSPLNAYKVLIGTDPAYTVYRLPIPTTEKERKIFYLELKLLTVGSIKIGIGPQVENFNCILEQNENFISWDPMESRLHFNNLAMDCSEHTNNCSKPKPGSVIQIKLFTMKDKPVQSIQFLLNTLPIRKDLQVIDTSGLNMNWDKQQYVYVALSMYQQVITCLDRDSWKHFAIKYNFNSIDVFQPLVEEELPRADAPKEFPFLDSLIENPTYRTTYRDHLRRVANREDAPQQPEGEKRLRP